MRTILAATCTFGLVSASALSSPALAQQRVTPGSPPPDSAQTRGLRWQLAPLVDGVRSVAVPVLPRRTVPPRMQPVANAAPGGVEYMIRIIVPDTTRLAPMPVMRPATKP